MSDVAHKVVAVGSRSVESAKKFIETYAGSNSSIKAVGSYEGVYADPVCDFLACSCLHRTYTPQDVTAVYIGTPHTMHYENARDALLAGKHVLCEKATTSNAAELRELLALAKEKNLFFMEAMWTRFLPVTLALKKVVEQGNLGDPILIHADLCHDFRAEGKPLVRILVQRKMYCMPRASQISSYFEPSPWWRGSSRLVS